MTRRLLPLPSQSQLVTNQPSPSVTGLPDLLRKTNPKLLAMLHAHHAHHVNLANLVSNANHVHHATTQTAHHVNLLPDMTMLALLLPQLVLHLLRQIWTRSLSLRLEEEGTDHQDKLVTGISPTPECSRIV
jgi:hypothetical protein